MNGSFNRVHMVEHVCGQRLLEAWLVTEAQLEFKTFTQALAVDVRDCSGESTERAEK